MKFGSLFSGIGGFDLAFERAGMTPAWNCEIDPKASEVLKRHWPQVPNLGDVRNVGRGTEPVDVICGGFPCQDLSVAGKRAGLAGERSGLWFEFARVIDELEPRWVVIENVPGLLSSDRGRDFAIILRWLAERGYGVAWRVLDAQYAGVAQRRRRVFVVASLGNGSAAEILFEREGVSWNPPARGEAGQDVAYSIRANPSHSGDKGDGGINTTLIGTGWDAQRARIHDVSGAAPTLQSGAKTSGNIIPAIAFAQNTRDEVRPMNGDGQIAGALAAQAGMKQQNYIAFNADQDGSVFSDNLSPTLTHKGDGKDAHGAYNKIAVAAFGGGNTSGPIDVAPTIHTGLGHHGWAVGDQDFGLLQAVPQSLQLQPFDDKIGGKGDNDNANATEARSYQILRVLRKEDGTEEVLERRITEPLTLQQAEVLRRDLYGASLRRQADERISRVDDGTLSRQKDDRQAEMRDLRKVQRPSRRSPQERRLEGQHSEQSASIVSGLSHSRTSETEGMQNLRGEAQGTWVLRETPEHVARGASTFGVRRLTPTECERLMGFPDGWTFGADSTRYRQLGNAVAVPVVEWIGRRLMEVA